MWPQANWPQAEETSRLQGSSKITSNFTSADFVFHHQLQKILRVNFEVQNRLSIVKGFEPALWYRGCKHVQVAVSINYEAKF